MPGMCYWRLVCWGVAVWLWLSVCAQAQEMEAAPPGISCRAFILYDLEHGRVIAGKNADSERQIASLTKLMTSLLVCERLRFDGRYVLTVRECKDFGTDTLRAQQMLELMLVASNNRTCEVVERITAGSEHEFVALMNQRARELGLANTQFANASGLPASGQHSTAREVLALFLELREHELARWAMGQHSVDVGGHRYSSTLGELYQRHPGLLGGKTGYTKAAGRCLALEYESDGHAYVLVTLGSSSVAAGFADAELLLRYYGLYNGALHTW